MAATRKTCEGKRRMWRGNKLGTFKCGRKAKWVGETYVGFTRSHYFCDDAECASSIHGGYGLNNVRALSAS